MKKIFSITDENDSSRLDRWFKRNICEVPQSLIEKNIRKGNIKVNSIKKKSSYKLKSNDKITIKNFNFIANQHKKVQEKYKATKKDLSLSSDLFIENNENFVVINKPAGVSVQSGTKSKKNILDILAKTKEFFNSSPYSVHRIDKDTTGILIVAKNRKFAQFFTSLFRIRKIHKTYLGIVVGNVEIKKGVLKDELLTFEGNKKIKSTAITNFTLLDSNSNLSLLKLNPITGRKHQLRKQLLNYGHPILGDNKYGLYNRYSNKKNLLMLHAYSINFSIVDKKYNFVAEPPLSFKKILKEKYLKIF